MLAVVHSPFNPAVGYRCGTECSAGAGLGYIVSGRGIVEMQDTSGFHCYWPEPSGRKRAEQGNSPKCGAFSVSSDDGSSDQTRERPII